jgi:hypothetical protein
MALMLDNAVGSFLFLNAGLFTWSIACYAFMDDARKIETGEGIEVSVGNDVAHSKRTFSPAT